MRKEKKKAIRRWLKLNGIEKIKYDERIDREWRYEESPDGGYEKGYITDGFDRCTGRVYCSCGYLEFHEVDSATWLLETEVIGGKEHRKVLHVIDSDYVTKINL